MDFVSHLVYRNERVLRRKTFQALSDFGLDFPNQNPILAAGNSLNEVLVERCLGQSPDELRNVLPGSRFMKIFISADEQRILTSLPVQCCLIIN